jgi:hypothetical protein
MAAMGQLKAHANAMQRQAFVCSAVQSRGRLLLRKKGRRGTRWAWLVNGMGRATLRTSETYAGQAL